MSTVINTDIALRWMVRVDLPAVADIERRNGGEWGEEDFIKVLREKNVVGIVVVDNKFNELQNIFGFVVYELFKEKLAVLNMGVHPDYIGKRIGTKIINKLKSKLSDRRKFIEFCVPETYLEFHLFLKTQDFKAVQVNRNYYGNEDCYVFKYGDY